MSEGDRGAVGARDAIEWHSAIAESFDESYSRSGRFADRLEIWTDLIRRHGRKGARVLDVGCGSGVFSQIARQLGGPVVGLDASQEMLELCRRKGLGAEGTRTDLVHGTLSACDLEPLGRFDLILCSSVLEYVEDFWGSVSLLTQALEVDGVLLLSVPNRHSAYRRAERLFFKATGRPRYLRFVRHQFDVRTLEGLLGKRGLEVAETRLYGGMAVLHRITRLFRASELWENLIVVACYRRKCPERPGPEGEEAPCSS